MNKTIHFPDFKEPMGLKYVHLENDVAFYAVRERYGKSIKHYLDKGHGKYESVRKGFLDILAHGKSEDLNEIIKYKIFLLDFVTPDSDLLRLTDFMFDNYNTMALFPKRRSENSQDKRYIFCIEIHKNPDEDPVETIFLRRKLPMAALIV